MVQLRDLVPGEAGVRRVQVYEVKLRFNPGHDEVAVFKEIGLRDRVGDAAEISVVVRPRILGPHLKIPLLDLQIEVRVEKRMERQPPELAGILALGPLIVRTSLDDLAKHGESSKILAREGGFQSFLVHAREFSRWCS